MAVAKVIEVSASSADSFEDAIQQGIKRATQSVDDVQGAWVQGQKVVVEKGEVKEFRVDLKVTFLVHA